MINLYYVLQQKKMINNHFKSLPSIMPAKMLLLNITASLLFLFVFVSFSDFRVTIRKLAQPQPALFNLLSQTLYSINNILRDVTTDLPSLKSRHDCNCHSTVLP